MAYTTTSPTDIDFMYKLPEQEMLQAISTSDQAIDKTNDQADMYSKYINDAKSKALPGDVERLDTISKNYQNRINDVTNNIAQDPSNYRQYSPQLRGISRQLQNDTDISTINSRYSQYQKWLADNKDADPTLLEAAKNRIMGNHGYDNKTGYSPLSQSLEEISKPIDWAKKAKDWHSGMQPISSDGSYTTIADIENNKARPVVNANGQWLVKTEHGTEYVSKDRVAQNFDNNFNSDLEAQRWVKQSNTYLPSKQVLGQNTNNIDIDNVTPRFIYKPIGTGDYMLNQAREAAIGTYAYKKTKSKMDLSTNPNEMSHKDWEKENIKVQQDKLERSQDLQDQETSRKEKEHADIIEKVGDALDPTSATSKASKEALKAVYGIDNPTHVLDYFNQAQANNPVQNANTQSATVSAAASNSAANQTSTKASTQASGTKATISTTVAPIKVDDAKNGTINVNYFNGEKALNPAIITGNIESTKANIDVLSGSLKNETVGSDTYRKINEELSQQQSRLTNQLNISKSVDDYAKVKYEDNLKKKGIDPNKVPYEKVLSEMHQIDSLKSKGVKIAGAPNEYLSSIKDAYDNAKTEAYKNASAKANESVKTIGITADRSNNIVNKIGNNLNNFVPKIINGETGNDISKQDISNSVFSNWYSGLGNHTGSLNPKEKNSLTSFYNGNLSDHIQVTGITHAPGYGAVAIVKIDGVKGDHLMTLPNDVAYDIAKSIKPKDTNEQTIVNNIVNQKKSNILNELTPPISYAAGLSKQGISPSAHEFTTTIEGKEIKAKILPSFDNNGKLQNIKVQANKEGQWIDYPNNIYPTIQNFVDSLVKK